MTNYYKFYRNMAKNPRSNRPKVKRYKPSETNTLSCVNWPNYKNNKICRSYKEKESNSKNTKLNRSTK